MNVLGANLAASAALDHMDEMESALSCRQELWVMRTPCLGRIRPKRRWINVFARRVEHPDRRFICVTMGNSQPTEFANQMGVELLGAALEAWQGQAIPSAMTEADDVGCSRSVVCCGSFHPEIDSSELKIDAREA